MTASTANPTIKKDDFALGAMTHSWYNQASSPSWTRWRTTWREISTTHLPRGAQSGDFLPHACGKREWICRTRRYGDGAVGSSHTSARRSLLYFWL